MIRTKGIYRPREDEDGVRILVTRFYPRGVRRSHFDRWARELAPGAGLLKRYRNHGISWQEFAASFMQELQGSKAGLQAIDRLRSEAARSNITLLCYEPDGAPCHRHLLREIIKEPRLLGADFVPEYAD